MSEQFPWEDELTEEINRNVVREIYYNAKAWDFDIEPEPFDYEKVRKLLNEMRKSFELPEFPEPRE